MKRIFIVIMLCIVAHACVQNPGNLDSEFDIGMLSIYMDSLNTNSLSSMRLDNAIRLAVYFLNIDFWHLAKIGTIPLNLDTERLILVGFIAVT